MGGQDWLSVADAAVAARVSPRTIERWLTRGKIDGRVADDGRREVRADSLPRRSEGGHLADTWQAERAALTQRIRWLEAQVEERTRAESELRVLLLRAEDNATAALRQVDALRALPPAPARPWWKLWGT